MVHPLKNVINFLTTVFHCVNRNKHLAPLFPYCTNLRSEVTQPHCTNLGVEGGHEAAVGAGRFRQRWRLVQVGGGQLLDQGVDVGRADGHLQLLSRHLTTCPPGRDSAADRSGPPTGAETARYTSPSLGTTATLLQDNIETPLPLVTVLAAKLNSWLPSTLSRALSDSICRRAANLRRKMSLPLSRAKIRPGDRP